VLIRPLALALALAVAAPLTAQTPETITVDATAPGQPFPHFWERMFGSGRAALSLRESYGGRRFPLETDAAPSYAAEAAVFELRMAGMTTSGHVRNALIGKAAELNRIVDDLLTAARIEGGTVPTEVKTVDLRELTRQAIAYTRARLELNGLNSHLLVADAELLAGMLE